MSTPRVERPVFADTTSPQGAFVIINGHTLSGPVSDEQFRYLWDSSQESSYGVAKQSEDGESVDRRRVVDPAVRNSRETTNVMFHSGFLSELCDLATDRLTSHYQMAFGGDKKPRDDYDFRFHKCLMYNKDGFFGEHVDMQRYPLMTHTMIYNLEMEDFGNYTFTLAGKERSLSTRDATLTLFRRDLPHSMKMVSGNRVCLVFHVIDKSSREYYRHYSNSLEVRED